MTLYNFCAKFGNIILNDNCHVIKNTFGLLLKKIHINVNRVNSITFIFTLKFVDGGVTNENIILNDKLEYHTNNQFGEYYKFNGKTLVLFDNIGMIGYYE